MGNDTWREHKWREHKWREHKWRIWAGVSVVIALFVIYIEVVPRIQQGMAHWQTWTKNTQELARADQWETTLNRLHAELAEVERAYVSAYEGDLTGARVSATLKQLRRVSAAQNITLREIRPEEMNEHDVYSDRIVTLHFEDAFPAAVRLIHGIEQSDRLMRVEEARLTSEEYESSEVAVALRLRVIVPKADLSLSESSPSEGGLSEGTLYGEGSPQ